MRTPKRCQVRCWSLCDIYSFLLRRRSDCTAVVVLAAVTACVSYSAIDAVCQRLKMDFFIFLDLTGMRRMHVEVFRSRLGSRGFCADDYVSFVAMS